MREDGFGTYCPLVEASAVWIQHLLWSILLFSSAWIAISGIDDLFVDCLGWLAAFRTRKHLLPLQQAIDTHPQKSLAILTPLWNESQVIGRMVQQNSERIRYGNYHFFVGAYPNDSDTIYVVQQLEKRFPHVHLAQCPHPGPTSKADCLNWVYQRLLAFERQSGLRFDVLITHDAEDVIHADSLHWINYFSDQFQMVQVPVLPLPTPLRMLTHGLYCDEFAEYQARDMPARQYAGAFVPSNGVGTGFRRDAIEKLASSESNRVFEPTCLTEDYENGLRLKLLGANQVFLPTQWQKMTTREFFPQTFKAAVRQRTRWVTGIALQTWERHGWRGGLIQKYWLWRDRKGLIGSFLSLLTNLLFLYGAISWAAGYPLPWHPLFGFSVTIGVYRAAYRMWCVGRLFGPVFALGVPVRTVYGNVINALATAGALKRFARSKLAHEPLVWLKTEHAFPSQVALETERPSLEDILVKGGYVTQTEIDEAFAVASSGLRIGHKLVQMGYLQEDSLCEALSLQQGLPQVRVDPDEVNRLVARSLPARIIKEHQVLPVRVEFGNLVLASPDAPSLSVEQALRRYTGLTLQFHLVTLTNFEQLTRALL